MDQIGPVALEEKKQSYLSNFHGIDEDRYLRSVTQKMIDLSASFVHSEFMLTIQDPLPIDMVQWVECLLLSADEFRRLKRKSKTRPRKVVKRISHASDATKRMLETIITDRLNQYSIRKQPEAQVTNANQDMAKTICVGHIDILQLALEAISPE